MVLGIDLFVQDMTGLPDLVTWGSSESTVTNSICDLYHSPPHRQCISVLFVLVVDVACSTNG